METTKKFLRVLILVMLFSQELFAQELPDNDPINQKHGRSTLDLVYEVRDSIGLDNKEFDKVYLAYDKYRKAVYGDNGPMPDRIGRPHGRHPGGHGGIGGFGVPGGMPPTGAGIVEPVSGFGGRDFGNGTRPKQAPMDMEKLEKKRIKAEAKLCKSMKKIFKKSSDKYARWLTIRDLQLKRDFSRSPSGNDIPRN